jgi:hypothetical protein
MPPQPPLPDSNVRWLERQAFKLAGARTKYSPCDS